jgi:PEP-CTERM motif
VTQDECLASPHHFTHLGVCYPGTNASIQISSPQHPQPVTFSATSVPEPSTAALLVLALVVGVVAVRIRARARTSF